MSIKNVLLGISVLYPLFEISRILRGTNYTNHIEESFIISIVCFLIFTLSFFNSFLRQYIKIIGGVLVYLVTFHFFYNAYSNNFSYSYLLSTAILLIGMPFAFTMVRTALFYFSMVGLIIFFILITHSNQHDRFINFFALIVVGILSFIAHNSRFKYKKSFIKTAHELSETAQRQYFVIQSIIDNSSTMVCGLNEKNEILFLNQSFHKFFKSYYQVNVNIGDHLIRVLEHLDENFSDVLDSYIHQSKSGENVKFLMFLDKDLETKYIEVNINPILGDKPIYSLNLIDVTENKTLELSLLENNQFMELDLMNKNEELNNLKEEYEIIFNASPVALFLLDVNDENEFYFNKINPTTLSVMGKNLEEIINHTPTQIFGEKIGEDFKNNYGKCIQQRKMIQYVETTSLTNEEITWNTTLIPFFKNGKIENIVGLAINITKEKQFIQSLEISEKKFSKAFHNSPLAMSISKFETGEFIEVNQSFLDQTGYTKDEIIGNNIINLNFLISNQEDRNHIIGLLVKNGKLVNHEIKVKLKNGEIKIIWLSSDLLELHDGKFIFSAINDISEKKLAEENLKRSFEKEIELGEIRSRLITMVSHEFKTPLTTIHSATQLLIKNNFKWENDKKIHYYDNILTASNKMNNLLNDVLFMSKSNYEHFDMNPHIVNIFALFNEIKKEQEQAFSNPQKKIHLEFDCNLDEISIDSRYLRYIVSNLLNNALKYSLNHDQIEFIINVEENFLILKIVDHGIGIKKEDLKYIFDPFFRSKDVINIQGTGIGLTIVKQCIESLKGFIFCESEINKGTRFTVKLPIWTKGYEKNISN